MSEKSIVVFYFINFRVSYFALNTYRDKSCWRKTNKKIKNLRAGEDAEEFSTRVSVIYVLYFLVDSCDEIIQGWRKHYNRVRVGLMSYYLHYS